MLAVAQTDGTEAEMDEILKSQEEYAHGRGDHDGYPSDGYPEVTWSLFADEVQCERLCDHFVHM